MKERIGKMCETRRKTGRPWSRREELGVKSWRVVESYYRLNQVKRVQGT